MDEDELAEIRGAVAVQPTADFDTFGSAAAEAEKRKARADAAESSSQAPSLTAGPIIEELLAPVAESLGDTFAATSGCNDTCRDALARSICSPGNSVDEAVHFCTSLKMCPDWQFLDWAPVALLQDGTVHLDVVVHFATLLLGIVTKASTWGAATLLSRGMCVSATAIHVPYRSIVQQFCARCICKIAWHWSA